MPIQKNPKLIERYHQNDNVSIETLEKLEALELKHNPVHYSVMYESLMNMDPYFSDRVEASLKADTYNDEMAEVLYLELISRLLNLKLPTNEVEQLLSNLLQELKSWADTAGQKQVTIADELDSLLQQNLPDTVTSRIESIVIPTLQEFFTDTDQLKKSVLESTFEVKQLKAELHQANVLAKTDELTAIPNRRGFNAFLEQVRKEATQQQSSFALIIFDIDFFKSINDTYGHLIGDSTLRYIAKLLASETKGRDYIARIGGEEFAIILPNTDYNAALKVANNIRLEIASKKLYAKTHTKALTFTVSGGVATYQMNEALEQVIQRADNALYHSKNHGRNRISGEERL
jgi:diguanylate cyclase